MEDRTALAPAVSTTIEARDSRRWNHVASQPAVWIFPTGTIQRSLLLAFHEPKQYQASRKWWAQFAGRKLDRGLSLKGEIDGISGATMTSHAGVAVTRRVLALFERKLAKTILGTR